MRPGDKVRKRANPSRVGILGNETDGPPSRLRFLVNFLDGAEEFVLLESLERVEVKQQGPFELIQSGRFGRVSDLRGAITYYRLSGKLANLIYSLNTTNTQFLPYQFKPVLQFLGSPSSGILIADEVGLGKTIEAGLIWTELRARQDARRLLVVCPAMLQDKWKLELLNRFGVNAESVNAAELLGRLERVKERPQEGFALIASMQGIRPPSGWADRNEPSQSAAAKLARFLEDSETSIDDALLDLTIIDEAHYLRNESTQTYRLGRLLRPASLSMVMLSATPIQLKSTDLFNLLHLLDEDAFPYEGTFEFLLNVNAPVVRLRDRILAGLTTRDEFVNSLQEMRRWRHFESNLQVNYLLDNPPSDEALRSARGRSELADQLDRMNPLTKVVTRTLKRDVDAQKVVREPHVIRATMTDVESEFYEAVTNRVREYCQDLDVSEGFLLTIPQRQMSSSMAAACKGWQARLSQEASVSEDEDIFELDADETLGHSVASKERKTGSLLSQLVAIAQQVGDHFALRQHDSKYSTLITHLQRYWKNNKRKKVVLFSFYRATLHYLADRLAEDGVESVVLHGGMNKSAALAQFSDPNGPDILLSSEVAAEGVDLQFSSLVINYDLPWNPAKIEQRIGRIDRIGQESPRILIWNLVYADTIDDRVCERLLVRLGTFERALGSMEAVLGEEIRALSYALLSHRLTPKQEKIRIDRACVAIENVNRQQEQLEVEATNLLAHGDFIQNKVKAANELGRYIRGIDLLSFVRDFLQKAYPGSRVLGDPKRPDLFQIDLSTEGRIDFTDFLQASRLQGRTALLASPPPKFLFENRLGKSANGVERVTQDHPLPRFVSQQLTLSGSAGAYFPVSACLVKSTNASIPKGDYVYLVARWSVSGSREVERLEYAAKSQIDGSLIESDIAESIVNAAALEGDDWLGAAGELDTEVAARLQDECRAELEEGFRRFRDSYQREDADRIQMMIRTLEIHRDRNRRKLLERIELMKNSTDPKRRKIVPMLQGQIKNEAIKFDQRIAELQVKARMSAQDTVVSCGVIRVL